MSSLLDSRSKAFPSICFTLSDPLNSGTSFKLQMIIEIKSRRQKIKKLHPLNEENNLSKVFPFRFLLFLYSIKYFITFITLCNYGCRTNKQMLEKWTNEGKRHKRKYENFPINFAPSSRSCFNGFVQRIQSYWRESSKSLEAFGASDEGLESLNLVSSVVYAAEHIDLNLLNIFEKEFSFYICFLLNFYKHIFQVFTLANKYSMVTRGERCSSKFNWMIFFMDVSSSLSTSLFESIHKSQIILFVISIIPALFENKFSWNINEFSVDVVRSFQSFNVYCIRIHFGSTDENLISRDVSKSFERRLLIFNSMKSEKNCLFSLIDFNYRL